jgi:hypothetical protein
VPAKAARTSHSLISVLARASIMFEATTALRQPQTGSG